MMLAAALVSLVCAATPVHGEALPKSGGLSQLKWVQATPHRAGLVGMLFAFDEGISGVPPRLTLWAGGKAPGKGPNQKILWVIRNQGETPTIVVRGTQIGGTGGRFRQEFHAVGGTEPEGTAYASIVNVPHAGCWRLDVASGRIKGSVVVQVVIQ
jgi:hypothetical protein